ncbi:MAG: GyrI-like domain-containing protein [Syntrophomonas sp.]|uniref:GyrI-like domain-containing protein n=1 Tax=Syntrophomonas sp. TaxID=2053627 RepID=UPI0026144F88|nr:GyrI-like domain-containing protein [Syntrophomonas sp.]MDD2511130.1 GyrI-like domain-containing protein [Syntrophomonas sp.]MDD4627208.1 GyrI-like domain-containing protein [Syntrophomonas sp.]
MQYQFVLEEKKSQPTISIRTRTALENLPQVLGKAYEDIMNYLSEIGIQPSGAPYVGYFNTDMQDLDIECGLPVAQSVAGTNELKPGEIPAGRQVSCLYTGPYSQIEPAYNAIMEWITANGYTPTGVCYEFYLNDPAETPENELLTRIVFLLK